MSRYALSRAARQQIERFARSGPLLVFDFDGTLAPIVQDPARARMPPATRRRLARAARAHPCAVVSGRARDDVRRRVNGIELVAIVGNHGIEDGGRPLVAPAKIAGWKRVIQARLGDLPGVRIEDKRYSLSVHYRQAGDRARARREILRSVEGLRSVRLVLGKEVVNVVPKAAPHKGTAVRRLATRLGTRRVLFVGDDVTDEDAFALSGPSFIGIRVGVRRGSFASHHLKHQSEIDDLLDLLIGAVRA